jgi:hypothetical protein
MNKESLSVKSLTDWDRLMAMTDEDIDFSDCPEATPEMFANSIVKKNGVIVRKSISLPARDNLVDVLPSEIRLAGKGTDFFAYLIEEIAVDDTWEVDLIQLMRHPNVTFRAGYLNLVRSLCAVEPRWIVKRDMRFFVVEAHREVLMCWILDRSREDIKPEEKLLNSHKEYLLRLPIRNTSSFRCEVIL